MANNTPTDKTKDSSVMFKDILSRIKISKPLAQDLFSDVALKVARKISKDDNTNSATQMRRFFNELVLWQDKVGFDEEQFKQAAPFIQMMRAKVAYAKSRKYVDANFQDVMNRLIPQITDIETLNNAKLFFEALIGFKKAFEKDL